MKTLLFLLGLLAGVARAETNYVYCTDGAPSCIGTEFRHDAIKDHVMIFSPKPSGLVPAGWVTMGGIDWTHVKVAMTTDKLPKHFTNINQVAHTVILPLKPEEKSDWRRRLDPAVVAVVEALVQVVNSKQTDSAKVITEAEVKAVLETKLPAVSSVSASREDGR